MLASLVLATPSLAEGVSLSVFIVSSFIALGAAFTNLVFLWRHVVVRDPGGSYIPCVGSIAAWISVAAAPNALTHPPNVILWVAGICALLDLPVYLIELAAELVISACRRLRR